MGLFKEFKDDFSQAVNELVPGDVPEKEVEPKAQTADNLVVDTIGENVDVASELSKLDGLLEHVEEQPQETTVPRPTPSENFAEHTINTQKEEQIPQMNDIPQPVNTQPVNNNVLSGDVQDETSVITASTVLTGDLHSSGSFEGEIVSTGTVKIGAGSVIIGNISASSAVIAGAVKGDIDVQGPVVVDTSAVIMGNIKSRSVQINNGAVIEGFCSQTYADIDVQGLFEGK